jgi:uncharacterized damage-inducible protein DinB
MSTALKTLFAYHEWANADLFDKLDTLDPGKHKAELHTALRLLNHYYVVAQIFRAHLLGQSHAYKSDNTEETPTRQELRAAVAASDGWYRNFIAGVSPADLSRTTAFTFTDGDKGFMSKEEMLIHVALHGGYHRGEIGRLLWQLSMTPPWDTVAVFLHQSDPARRQQGA